LVIASRSPGEAAGRWFHPNRGTARVLALQALELFALTAFAVAQPLYDLVSRNPTFLVAHQVSGTEVLWYALALLLVPPALLLVIESLVAVVWPAALGPCHALLVGLLVALALTPPIARALDLGAVLWLTVFAAVAVVVALLRARVPVVATVLRAAALAAPVFLALFLTSGGVRDLLTPTDAGAVAPAVGSGTSLVWLVLDELPVGLLLDDAGQLDRERFPGFARLADVSTWYPAATASSPRTNVSVLSALTGQHPESNSVLPVASRYPVNAFSLLGAGHELRVREAVTQLCPPSLCPDAAGSLDRSLLWSDTWTIFVRAVTPDSVADEFVPETDDRWAGYGDSGVSEDSNADDAEPAGTGDGGSATASTGTADTAGEVTSMDQLYERIGELTGLDQRLLLDAVIDSVGDSGPAEPRFTYLHAILPHIPYRYLPGGLAYDRVRSYESIDGIRWVEDPAPLEHMMQRMLLQTQYADEQVGRLVDELEAAGRLDDTMVVVMSDHGVSMTPGTKRREYQAETVDDMLPIPLFVHYPGASGTMDRRPAQPVDLLPTVVEVLGVEVPDGHVFDGHSLLGPPQDGTELTTPDGVVDVTEPPDAMAGRVLAMKHEMFAADANFYRPRDDGSLVGTPAPESSASETPDLRAEISGMERYADVRADRGVVPAHVVGLLAGRDEPVELAVALNGTVAGVGGTYRVEDGWQIAVMVDPTFLNDGANDLTLWEVTPSGLAAIPLD
jgi:Sulfatase